MFFSEAGVCFDLNASTFGVLEYILNLLKLIILNLIYQNVKPSWFLMLIVLFFVLRVNPHYITPT